MTTPEPEEGNSRKGVVSKPASSLILVRPLGDAASNATGDATGDVAGDVAGDAAGDVAGDAEGGPQDGKAASHAGDGQPFEILFAERPAKASFAGGALVFPGGVVEPDDARAPPLDGSAPLLALTRDERAGRMAALRETWEEAGIALEPSETPGWLKAGDPHRGVAEPETVVSIWPWCRWITPGFAPKRFDTRFYIACVAGPTPIKVDGDEIVASRWLTPTAALEAASRREILLVFSTLRIVERLAHSSTIGDLRRDAPSDALRPVMPQLRRRGEESFLFIPADRGYGGPEWPWKPGE